ncbi:hypothetical protein FKM82_007511 [Ascaphus truei]
MHTTSCTHSLSQQAVQQFLSAPLSIKHSPYPVHMYTLLCLTLILPFLPWLSVKTLLLTQQTQLSHTKKPHWLLLLM